MKYFIPTLFLVIGYGLGNWMPLNDLLFPKAQLSLTKDFLLKAGTMAQQRHFGGSSLNVPIEIDFESDTTYARPEFQLIQKK